MYYYNSFLNISEPKKPSFFFGGKVDETNTLVPVRYYPKNDNEKYLRDYANAWWRSPTTDPPENPKGKSKVFLRCYIKTVTDGKGKIRSYELLNGDNKSLIKKFTHDEADKLYAYGVIVRQEKLFADGGDIEKEDEAMKWVESNIEEIIQFYLPASNPSQVYDTNQYKNEGDYIIYDYPDGISINVYFGDKYDQALAEINQDYDLFANHIEDAVGLNLQEYSAEVMSNDELRNIDFVLIYRFKNGGTIKNRYKRIADNYINKSKVEELIKKNLPQCNPNHVLNIIEYKNAGDYIISYYEDSIFINIYLGDEYNKISINNHSFEDDIRRTVGLDWDEYTIDIIGNDDRKDLNIILNFQFKDKEGFNNQNLVANSILRNAVLSGFITQEVAEKPEITKIAKKVANGAGDMEEIGSSDMTFLLLEFLREIGAYAFWDEKNDRLDIGEEKPLTWVSINKLWDDVYAEGGDLTIQKTIRQQIGGQALYMLGAQNFVADKKNNALMFRIRGSNKVNFIKITLNSMDLYDMEFGKVWGNTYKVIAEENGVYSDMLNPLIKKHTGLNTKLEEGGDVAKHGGFQRYGEVFDAEKQVRLYYVMDLSGSVKFISPDYDTAQEYLQTEVYDRRLKGSLGTTIVPKKDWEEGKVNNFNVIHYYSHEN